MTDREISQRLRGFRQVWARVSESKMKTSGTRLMPGKNNKCSAKRLRPPGR